MEQSKLFEQLKNPSVYDEKITSVEIIETHISFVVLTGRFVYKIKKEVDFGFLDFSTLEKRKHFCEEEVRLNKRLCPELYLDVVRITEEPDGSIAINGNGPVIEYAVKMVQFPQENIMTNLLHKRKITKKDIENICNILVEFYNADTPSDEYTHFGKKESIQLNIVENFEQTQDMIDVTIPKSTYQFIQTASVDFLERKKEVFTKRLEQGYIHDCHGDLHSGNIVIKNGDICIFDCIEFNKRFRFIDVASDIGFFAMDLDFLNHPFLSSHLITCYIEQSKDTSVLDVLNFYKSYRAYVRGKVLGFRLSDPHLPENEKEKLVETAGKYFALSEYYTHLFSLDLSNMPPLLFMVSGLTGTGKSTLSSKLAVDYHAEVINTDVVRKELAGINKFERHHDEPNTGLYAPEKIDQTYQHVLVEAEKKLQDGINVILDATFQKRKHRDLARRIAEKHNACFVAIHCICSEELVKKWLEERLKEKTVSDGRWEIYQSQKKTFEPFTQDEKHIVFDMAKETYEERMQGFKQILTQVQKAVIT